MTPPVHVLVVGGGNGVVRASRPGTRTTFLTLAALLPNFRDLTHHARLLVLSGDEPDDVVLEVVGAIHRADPFTAVACFGEPLTRVAADLAYRLGVRGVPSPATARRIVDKEVMRTCLAEAGVEETRAQVVDDVDHLLRVLGNSPRDRVWIVKPAAGAGSLGVSRVTFDDDLEAALKRATTTGGQVHPDHQNRRVLVEPFLSGPQFSVEAVTARGHTTVLAITQKYSDPDSFVELGHVVPAPLPDEVAAAIQAHTATALDAIGITDSVTHTEVVLTEDGPRIIETHARIGGDDIGEMASITSGVDISALSGDLVLGEDISARLANASPSGGAEAVWFATSPEGGTFAGLDGVTAAQAVHPSVEVTELLGVGDPVEPLASSDSRVAQVRASGATAQEAMNRVRKAARMLSVRVARSFPVDSEAGGLV